MVDIPCFFFFVFRIWCWMTVGRLFAMVLCLDQWALTSAQWTALTGIPKYVLWEAFFEKCFCYYASQQSGSVDCLSLFTVALQSDCEPRLRLHKMSSVCIYAKLATQLMSSDLQIRLVQSQWSDSPNVWLCFCLETVTSICIARRRSYPRPEVIVVPMDSELPRAVTLGI